MKSPSSLFRTRPGQRGFNLIELMIVLVIIGLLAGVVGPRLLTYLDRGSVTTAEVQIKTLRAALDAFRLDVGRYPTTQEGLASLMAAPGEVADYWRGPYLDAEVPVDPWRTAYRYEYPVNNLHGYALYSLGADQAPGGEGADADIGYLPDGEAG